MCSRELMQRIRDAAWRKQRRLERLAEERKAVPMPDSGVPVRWKTIVKSMGPPC